MKTDLDFKHEIQDHARSEPSLPASTKRKSLSAFVIGSGLVHFIAAAAIVITNHVPENERESELVEIDFSAPTNLDSAPEWAPLPEQTATIAAATPEPATETQAIETPEIVAPKAQPQKSLPNPPPAAPLTPSPKPAVTASLADIKTPTLDDSIGQVESAKSQAALNPQDLDADLNQVDEEQAKELQAVAAQMNEETAQTQNALSQAADAAAEQVKKENELAAAALAAKAENLRAEEAARTAAAAVAAAEAAEAEALAKAESDKMKAEKNQEGSAEKDAGPGVTAPEVRALEQLRQMPGNPVPLYEADERLRGDKGLVVFQAFVTQEGRLNDFKLVKSTGHRNLDAKTLKALKQWKFYPGQEGRVELPFDWNLKGGAQEMPAFLRRKVGQSP